MKASFHLLNVFAILNRRHDGSVSRWPADSLLFKSFNECGFSVARRRRREVLLGSYLLQLKNFPLLHHWESTLGFFIFFGFFVATFLIELEETVELLYRSGCSKLESTSCDIDRCLVEDPRGHLRGDGTLPDKAIEF